MHSELCVTTPGRVERLDGWSENRWRSCVQKAFVEAEKMAALADHDSVNHLQLSSRGSNTSSGSHRRYRRLYTQNTHTHETCEDILLSALPKRTLNSARIILLLRGHFRWLRKDRKGTKTKFFGGSPSSSLGCCPFASASWLPVCWTKGHRHHQKESPHRKLCPWVAAPEALVLTASLCGEPGPAGAFRCRVVGRAAQSWAGACRECKRWP